MSGIDVSAAAPGERDERNFRSDLEGLRAVAVALVLLYHARVPGLAGGYVGVDVFFVLSGFLITGLLVRELGATGRISLPAFYARRARRLLPAAALVLFATAIASALILAPLRMPDVAADIVSAAGYASNIWFALQATDYLASDLPPSPVLHYWSLGVEEQFYLFWPALLVLVAGAAYAAGDRATGIRRVTVTLVVVLFGSLALAIWLTGVQQPWAFFSLPSRAWELALGGLLAMPVMTRLASPRITVPIGWLGLALVVASGFVLSDAIAFPGVAALLPTVGGALVIFGGLGHSETRHGRPRLGAPGRLLSFGPIRYIGRISYSLYLWHWPVLVLPVVAFGELSLPLRLGLVGLAVGLAAMSHRLVEEPIRHGRFVGERPPRVLAAAGALSLAVGLSAAWLGWRSIETLPAGTAVGGNVEDVDLPPLPSAPIPSASGSGPGPGGRLPPLAAAPLPADLMPSLPAARDDLPVIYDDGCHAKPAATSLPEGCVFGDPGASTSVVLFGDSHAAQWFPTLERLANEQHWRLISLTKSACASVDVPVWSQLFERPYDECTAWRREAFDLITEVRPLMVVISNDRNYSLTIDGGLAFSKDHEDVWDAGLEATVRRIASLGAKVVVIGDTVRQTVDPPVCLSEHLDDASACSTPYDAAVADRVFRDRQVTEALGQTFIDPTPWMCSSDPCPSVIGRFLVYRDTHHMTATFARALSQRLLALLPVAP